MTGRETAQTGRAGLVHNCGLSSKAKTGVSLQKLRDCLCPQAAGKRGWWQEEMQVILWGRSFPAQTHMGWG